MIITRRMQGEAREIGKFLAGLADGIGKEGLPAPSPVCILMGGETTVTVRGKGLGGRCQELALSFLAQIANCNSFCLLSAGTDGKDGTSPAAGAIVDTKTLKLIKKQKVDVAHYLNQNDSYRCLNGLGGLIPSAPTGTNVMDIVVLLVC